MVVVCNILLGDKQCCSTSTLHCTILAPDCRCWCDLYAIDQSFNNSISEHVDFVGGVLHFPQTALRTKVIPSKKHDFDLAVTPRFLKDQVYLLAFAIIIDEF